MKLISAIIGLGVGYKHYLTYKKNNVKVHTVSDLDLKKIIDFNKIHKNIYTTQNNKLIFSNKDINIVSVASYDQYHYRQIISLIKNKKNIFSEKPICLKESEFLEIKKELNKQKNIKFSCNLVLRASKFFLILNKMIKEKELGKIYHIEAEYNYGRAEKLTRGWRGKINRYSVMLGGGIHLLDLILQIVKSKLVKVNSLGNNIGFRNKKNILSNKVSILKFKNGITAKITSNFLSKTNHHHVFKVFGTNGSFFYDNEKVIIFDKKKRSKSFKCKTLNSQKEKILVSFINSIRDGKNNEIVKKKEIFALMEALFKIEKS